VAADNAPTHISLQVFVVYIAEAHALDEWPISSARYTDGEVCLPQTRTLQERIEVANSALAKLGFLETESSGGPEWKVFVAPPEEEKIFGSDIAHFESDYKPWPFRGWGFVNTKIDYIAEPHACEVKIEEMRDWLGHYISLP
jgi:hypothetical protein